jgi:carboxypeptidase C (cathepsin A)
VFQELGPCAISQDGSQANYNQESWNQVSNLLFFDQVSRKKKDK